MARIFDEWLNSVAYLYPSRAAALQSQQAGGSGVLVAVSEGGLGDPPQVRYVLTNAHVALTNRFVRLNLTGGGFETIEVDSSSWHWGQPDDFAFAALALDDHTRYTATAIDWEGWVMSRPDLATYEVGPGDDVAMVGRLQGFDGELANHPVARFGNVARMPAELFRDGAGNEVEAFLVDMRSQSGYSGSPVFVHINYMQPRNSRQPSISPKSVTGLLGIDAGHTSLEAPVVRRGDAGLVGTDLAVRLNSGIAIVVPAYRIDDALNWAEVRDERTGLAVDERYVIPLLTEQHKDD